MIADQPTPPSPDTETPRVVHLVGAGPGDPDLLTLGAEQALQTAREIVADASLAPLLDTLVAEGLIAAVHLASSPTRSGSLVGPVVTWVDDDRAAAAVLLEAVDRGPGVVRLYRGDPWFHPAGDAERLALTTAGIGAQPVAGVVEELALTAAAGIPVQVRALAVATTFAVETPDCGFAAEAIDAGGPPPLALPADPAHTVVVRTTDLGITLVRLAADARRQGIDAERPAAALPIGSSIAPLRGALSELAHRAPAGPGVVVVGLVAALDTRMVPTAGGRAVAVVGLVGGRPVGPDAVAALRTATLVAGSPDQLAATADLRRAEAITVVVAGGLGALDAVVAHDGPACVLASGDPGFFGIARALRTRLAAAHAAAPGGAADDRCVMVHPAPSSVALAFARAGVSWDQAIVRSCHTGIVDRSIAAVAVAPTAAVLCGPGAPPETVAAALLAHGARHALAVVASCLAEPDEQVTVGDLHSIAAGTHPHRSVLVVAHPEHAVAASLRPGGRPVDKFSHRAGMITKPEVRSVVLGKLELPAEGVFWDVGAGSGSVAIEASLAAPGLRVIAVEQHRADADRAVANAAAHDALVEVVTGGAPAALQELPDPDRVFVGGGGLGVLDAAWNRLRPGGRLVATFAAIDRAAEAYRRLGSLVQVSVDRADSLPDGGVRFAADNPVFVAWGDKSVDQGIEPGGADGSPADTVGAPVAIGVGCSSHASADEVAAVVADALEAAPVGTGPVTVVATVDRRRAHPAVTALGENGVAGRAATVSFPSSLLATVAVPTPSAAVADAIGTPSVAEAAALLAAGPGSRLVVTKHKGATATAAVAVGSRTAHVGRLTVVGLGPGAAAHRTPAALAAVRAAEVVVGYGPYVDAVADLIRPDQRIVRSAMGAETDRGEAAASLAGAGWSVALVSSGDSGVFAMASTAIEAAAGVTDLDGAPLLVQVVPGVTAAHAAAAAVGAPLAAAHAAITLSDILIPWSRIEEQLRAAAGAGLALALYNPRSKGRPDHLSRALTVLGEVLPGVTPVAVVTAAGDPDQESHVATLATFDVSMAGMRSMVLVGTADTTVDAAGRLVTSRHHPPAAAEGAPQ